MKKPLFAILGLLFSCQSSQVVYLTEEITFPKHYYQPSNHNLESEKKEKRFVALYILGNPSTLLDNKDWEKFIDETGKDPISQNNRGIACLMLGKLSCAEEALLWAALSEHPLILHNLQVLYKWQQSEFLIYK